MEKQKKEPLAMEWFNKKKAASWKNVANRHHDSLKNVKIHPFKPAKVCSSNFNKIYFYPIQYKKSPVIESTMHDVV